MQEVRTKIDKQSPVITIRDLKKDGDRHFKVDCPSHAAVAPACLKNPLKQGFLHRLAQLFHFHTTTPDEHLANQELAAIRARLRTEHALKDKLTHIGTPSAAGTWVTHEEIDALENRQKSLMTLITRLRRERTLMTLLASVIIIVGAMAHLGYQSSDKLATPLPASEFEGLLIDAAGDSAIILSNSDVVVDYDQYAVPHIEPAEANAALPATNRLTTTYSPVDHEQLRSISAARPLTDIAAPTTREQQILAAAQSWLTAWSKQDVEAYLASYASDFTPPRGMSRPLWEEERRMRLLRPSSIEVSMSKPELTIRADGTAELHLLQHYRANTYADETAKTLIWVSEDGLWKIAAERSNAN